MTMMTEHTAKAFDIDLQELTRKVAEMGGLAEKLIADSVEALTRRDMSLAQRVVTGDAAVAFDDHRFALELLETEDVLVVPGSSFNVPYRNHFRVTLLPQPDDLREVFRRVERTLDRYAETARAQRTAVA